MQKRRQILCFVKRKVDCYGLKVKEWNKDNYNYSGNDYGQKIGFCDIGFEEKILYFLGKIINFD